MEFEAVLSIIREFLASVETYEPDTVYSSFRKGDSFEFLHIIQFPDIELETKHRDAVYTQKFMGKLYPKCETEPRFTYLSRIEY